MWLGLGKLRRERTRPVIIVANCGIVDVFLQLYIYDGDNVYSPLLGVFSGILLQRGGGYSALRNPEVVAKSGFALVHFYTDMAYNLTGFNISYR